MRTGSGSGRNDRKRGRDRTVRHLVFGNTTRRKLFTQPTRIEIMKTVADQFAETLAAAGVKRIYGIVGDSLNGFTDAIRRQRKIEWVHLRHEEVAAFAAGADAHLTGSLAVCAGSCGPCNLHPPRTNILRSCVSRHSALLCASSRAFAHARAWWQPLGQSQRWFSRDFLAIA